MATPISQLLKEFGWRSVRQEMYYHTALEVHKTMKTKKPVYMYNKLTNDGEWPRDTRQTRSGRGHHTKPNLDWQGTVLAGEDPIPMRLFHYRLEVTANFGNSRKN